ncbi:unnamed protein product [Closterium sp. NIES-54]
MAATTPVPALLLVLVLTTTSSSIVRARWLPSMHSSSQRIPHLPASASTNTPPNAGTAANRGGNVAKCVAAGLSELSSFHGASSRVFSTRSVFMAPGADEWTSFGPQDKADALRRLSDSIPNPSFAVQSVTSYRLLYSLYKPADHGLVVIGSVHSSAPGAESGSEQIGGRFLTFWDQVWPAEDAYNEDCSKWGLSWLMWQTRDENGLPAKRVPFTANVSADSSVSPDLGMAAKPSEQPAAEPADVTPDVLRMDDDFGHLDDVKSAQSSNEEARNGDKHETPNEPSQVKATLGQVEEPQQSDVTFYVQTAWSAFVSALAADDVASASSILFGPDAVTLMAPGADSITLATELEKANLLNELKASHLSLSVMVEEVAVLQGSESTQNSESSTISALVRSTYSIANAQGVDAEHGKRVELWRASATNEREWHLSWSMWNGNGHVLTREEAMAAYENDKFPQQRDSFCSFCYFKGQSTMAASSFPALQLPLLAVVIFISSFTHARTLPSVHSGESPGNQKVTSQSVAAKCVAAGLSEIFSFRGESSRRVFSPRAVFMAPGKAEQILFTPRDKEHALRHLRCATFTVETLHSYRILNSLYKPANNALVVLGSLQSAPSPANIQSDNNGGRFLAFWEQITRTEDDTDQECSEWGISWLMWQTRDEKTRGASKSVPLTATSANASVIADAKRAALASEKTEAEARNRIPSVLKMDYHFGHQDEVKTARDNEEYLKGKAGRDEEPQQRDVRFYVQKVWSAFVSALAADDVASASSNLFGPDAVTLMAPGADSITLATELQKTNLLKELKWSQLSLTVSVGEIAVLQDADTKLISGSRSYAALVRSNYTIVDDQGFRVEHGRRVELWRPSSTNPREWHLSWSMWNDDGAVFRRTSGTATS